MENLTLRFPGLTEKIFNKINDKSLVRCIKVSKTWKNFVEQQKEVWIRMIEYRIGKRHTFSDDWRRVVFKTQTQIVMDLAIVVNELLAIPCECHYYITSCLAQDTTLIEQKLKDKFLTTAI